MLARKQTSFVGYALPFFTFLIAGWYGLASVVQSKRDLRNATRGLDMVEEMDPVERMRQRYRLGAEGCAADASVPHMRSLEEELDATLKKINIKDFDYKPVPRTDEDE